MVIELFGLPGAGKTTLAKKLETEQGFKIVKIRSRWELLYLNLRHFFKNPVSSFMNLFFIIKSSPNLRLFYYKFMNFFMDINARYEKAGSCEKAILDQGYFQNILSVFEKPINQYQLEKYLRYLPKPDKLIVVDTPPEEIQRRVGERGYYSREKFGKEYVEKWRETTAQNYELVKAEIKNLGVNYEIIKEP